MDKVKIKRVKRVKKQTTAKEKILAGIGLGSTLMGGAGAVAPKTGQTQFVRTQTAQNNVSAAGKIKQTLTNIFGVKSAKAAITQEYLDGLGADVEAARAALANFDQWVTQARADAQNYGTQEETDARLAEIQATTDGERPALVSAVEAAESAYSQAADQFAAEQQGSGSTVQGPQAGEERTNGQGFVEVFDGSNWRLKDGQEKVIMGTVYVTQSGVWVEQQSSGGAVAHTYTITTGAPAVSVDVNSGAGMTYEIRDETGQLVNMAVGVSPSFSVSNPSVARVNAVPGTVEIIGVSEGTATVTINYAGASATFEVTVNALPGSGDQGGGDTGGAAALNISVPSISGVTAGQYQEFPFQATGGSGGYVWEKVSGPDWLLMDPNTGILYTENMPADLITGTVSVTVRVSDGSASAQKVFSISVYAPAQGGQTSGFSVGASQGTLSARSGNYTEFANVLQVSGGSGSYAYSIAMADGSMLPAGIGIGETGIIYANDNTFGQAPVPAGSYMLTVGVVDLGSGETKNIILNLQVQPSGTQTPPSQTAVSVNFSKADGSSAANLKVGDAWKISVTGAKPGVQVAAGTEQVLADGQKKVGVRVLGTTDSQGHLEVSDTVLAEHVGTWSMRLKVDGQDTGTVLNFSITAQGQTAAAPVGPDGKLRQGWVQDGTRYFNSSLGLYSNKDGRFQSRTSDGYAALLKADALSKFSPVYMTDVYTWNAWYQNPDGTMGRIENARNSYYYATLETASKLASLLGGTVETTYFGSEGGPFVDVLGKKAPKTQADLAPMYMIKINGVSNPAGLIALGLTNSYGLMPFEDIIAITKSGGSVWDAIAEQALKTTDAAGTTATAGGGTTGIGGSGTATQTQSVVPVITALSTASVAQNLLAQNYKVAIVGSNFNPVLSQNLVEIVDGKGAVRQITPNQVLAQGLIFTLPGNLAVGNYKIQVRNLNDPIKLVSNRLDFAVTASNAAASGQNDTSGSSAGGGTNTSANTGGGTTGSTSGTNTGGTGTGGTTTNTATNTGGAAAAADQTLVNQLQSQIAAMQSRINDLNSRISSQNTAGQTIVLNSSDTAQIAAMQNQIQQLNNLVQQLRSGGGTISVMGGGTTQAFQGLQMPAGYAASGGLQYQDPGTEGQVQGAGVLASYTVKKGDTLWNIAKKYYGDGRKWRKILEANPNCLSRPGNTRTLKIGAVLAIPSL